MRVLVDRSVCVGAGQCALAAPQVFDQDAEDGLVILLDGTPREEWQAQVREAVWLCPTSALSIDE